MLRPQDSTLPSPDCLQEQRQHCPRPRQSYLVPHRPPPLPQMPSRGLPGQGPTLQLSVCAHGPWQPPPGGPPASLQRSRNPPLQGTWQALQGPQGLHWHKSGEIKWKSESSAHLPSASRFQPNKQHGPALLSFQGPSCPVGLCRSSLPWQALGSGQRRCWLSGAVQSSGSPAHGLPVSGSRHRRWRCCSEASQGAKVGEGPAGC